MKKTVICLILAILLSNCDYDGFTYLHDIQNIYKSLTKKELHIKF